MIRVDPIGVIHTPYQDMAPFRPDPSATGDFFLEIYPEHLAGLAELHQFSHLVVLFYFDRTKKRHLKAHPPGQPGKEVGVYASRSPFRPNKVGMNICRVLRIEQNIIHTSPLDALDKTPIIDIKPYIPDLDCFPDANSGWLTRD